jgi:hypothetical protein
MSDTITPTDDLHTLLGPNPDVQRIYDNVLAITPSMTLPLMQVALWNAIEEFAIRSTYFRHKAYWQMACGVTTVDFNPLSASQIVVWVLDQWGLTQWEVRPPATLVDLQTPLAARTGWALLAWKPTSFATVCQLGAFPELWSTWFETILDGTMFRLYGQPAKPWSSPQLAQYHGTRFRQGMARARDIAERLHSNQQSPRRQYPYFAHGRRKN